ncbi:unnamed protein product, partial [Protopolystoma xenopodis]
MLNAAGCPGTKPSRDMRVKRESSEVAAFREFYCGQQFKACRTASIYTIGISLGLG